jgi:hypothetical protein
MPAAPCEGFLHRFYLAVVLAAVTLAGLAPASAAPFCDGFEPVRDRLYATYIGLVMEDLRGIDGADGDRALNERVAELSQAYVRKAAFGDMIYLRKLIGIGLFTAASTQHEPLERTFKLVCDVAQRAPNVLDPLTCAAIALDRARRSEADNRALARRMVEYARGKVDEDRSIGDPRKVLDDVATVAGCAQD